MWGGIALYRAGPAATTMWYARGAEMADDVASNGAVVSRVAPVARTPSTINVGGHTLPAVPPGAQGSPAEKGVGLIYKIPKGTPGLDSRVDRIRVMAPKLTGRHTYPNGYAVYMNKLSQTVNPLTGQTVSPSDPFAHIPLPW